MFTMFSGYDFAGKDSAFLILKNIKDKLPFKSVTRAAHADWLKKICAKVFGTHDKMKGTGAEDYYRMILTHCSDVMKLATENQDCFSNYIFEKNGKKMMSKDHLVVCTDGRYLNEIEYFQNMFSVLGHSERFFPNLVTRREYQPTRYAKQHHNFIKFKHFKRKFYNVKLDSYRKQIEGWAFETFGRKKK